MYSPGQDPRAYFNTCFVSFYRLGHPVYKITPSAVCSIHFTYQCITICYYSPFYFVFSSYPKGFYLS